MKRELAYEQDINSGLFEVFETDSENRIVTIVDTEEEATKYIREHR